MVETRTKEKNSKPWEFVNEKEQKKSRKRKKTQYFAKLNNCPTSPRKMRLVADLVRGEKVNHALNILKFSQKEASRRLEKLLLSAIANWQAKNEEASLEDADLFVKEIRVDGGSMLKRLRTAPQGRAHRIRKRSNHVTLVLGANDNTQS
jgi:large subunit ribosomal protein L22